MPFTKEQKREHYRKNREKILAQRKQYYIENRERILAQQKEYRNRKRKEKENE